MPSRFCAGEGRRGQPQAPGAARGPERGRSGSSRLRGRVLVRLLLRGARPCKRGLGKGEIGWSHPDPPPQEQAGRNPRFRVRSESEETTFPAYSFSFRIITPLGPLLLETVWRSFSRIQHRSCWQSGPKLLTPYIHF